MTSPRVLFLFCVLVGAMVLANMMGYAIASFFLFLVSMAMILWFLMRPVKSFRTMTTQEREDQASRCGGWDWTNED